jgi:hypothetical protein
VMRDDDRGPVVRRSEPVIKPGGVLFEQCGCIFRRER